MNTKEKVYDVIEFIKADVADNFSLEKSAEIVRYIYDRYFTEWNETRIHDYTLMNYQLYKLLNNQNYSLTKEQKDLIEECATLINRDILFKRVVETTNNIECPFKIQSKVKELLRGLALHQDYAEQYKTDSFTLMRLIKRDIKKDFVKQYLLRINERIVQVYGEDFTDYIAEKGIKLGVRHDILRDLIFFRPANKFGLASKTLKKTLLSVEKENALIPMFEQYYKYIENEIINATMISMNLSKNG